jgi:hypothetical protein
MVRAAGCPAERAGSGSQRPGRDQRAEQDLGDANEPGQAPLTVPGGQTSNGGLETINGRMLSVS